jgi:hypothetical protein
MSDYQAWGDETAAKMRDYYDWNRPRTFMEKLFGKRSTSPGIVADNLMLGLLNVALNCHAHFEQDSRVLYPWQLGMRDDDPRRPPRRPTDNERD